MRDRAGVPTDKELARGRAGVPTNKELARGRAGVLSPDDGKGLFVSLNPPAPGDDARGDDTCDNGASGYDAPGDDARGDNAPGNDVPKGFPVLSLCFLFKDEIVLQLCPL